MEKYECDEAYRKAKKALREARKESENRLKKARKKYEELLKEIERAPLLDIDLTGVM